MEKKKVTRLIEGVLIVPDVTNEWNPVDSGKLDAVRDRILSVFGGYQEESIFGAWRDESTEEIYNEPALRYTIALSSTKAARESLFSLALEIGALLEQKAVYVSVNTGVEAFILDV